MNDSVPHLTTALTGPLHRIEALCLQRQDEIEGWLRRQWAETPAPLYASVDLRNAGFKLAPVDTNLFPAGFNNLNPDFAPLCIQAFQQAIERYCPTAAGLVLIPENHTRNQYYLQNLATLASLIRRAGFRVEIASIDPALTETTTLPVEGNEPLIIHPLERDGDRVYVDDFIPCSVLLNNDLSGGRPEILDGIDQPVIPPLSLGWTHRLKSQHFEVYDEVIDEFSDVIDIDSWLLRPISRNCGQVDFMKREGEECLARNVEMLLEEIEEKYREYRIDQEPFVVIKSDAGTYGMGVMMVRSADEVINLNRKQRTKMASAKGGRSVSGAIVQEGVYTLETWGTENATAEPVIYMVDHFVVGGFYRVHAGRSALENLNAPGMHFQPLQFASCCNAPDPTRHVDAEPNRFYAYGVVARLALLAAAREIAHNGG